MQELIEQNEIDLVTFTSGSTVEAFVKSMPKVDLSRVTGICIGEKTALKAKEYGIRHFVSDEATVASMISKILEVCNEKAGICGREIRPRRLRENKNIRDLTRETRISPKSLVLPIFIKEGSNIKEEIKSLEGHFYYSPDTVAYAIEEALSFGVSAVLIFGIPKQRMRKAAVHMQKTGLYRRRLKK